MTSCGRPSFVGIRKCKLNRRRKFRRRPRSPQFEMLSMYALQDTDAVKQMVSEGKVVGLRKGALVYLESVDLRDGIVEVRPKGSTTTVWIPSQFLNYK